MTYNKFAGEKIKGFQPMLVILVSYDELHLGIRKEILCWFHDPARPISGTGGSLLHPTAVFQYRRFWSNRSFLLAKIDTPVSVITTRQVMLLTSIVLLAEQFYLTVFKMHHYGVGVLQEVAWHL